MQAAFPRWIATLNLRMALYFTYLNATPERTEYFNILRQGILQKLRVYKVHKEETKHDNMCIYYEPINKI